jgi:AIPR protein
MNLNTSIIDQRLTGVQNDICEQAKRELDIVDPGRLKSLAFVYLCVQTTLDLDHSEAFDCLTEGGGDFGVDAMHITEVEGGEFGVILFQSKYKTKLDGSSHFEARGIEAMVNAIQHIFDPSSQLGVINERLKYKVEAVRSLIRDSALPRIRAIACNNGLCWNEAAQETITRANFGNQVVWEHVNHDTLVGIMQRTAPVNETLRLTGKALVEDLNYSRVCLGRMAITEIATLIEQHGEQLLERNVRRYLGLHGNRVNQGISATLESDTPSNFYFFNNGLTLVCSDFAHNALQAGDYHIKVENLQIVNGGQTCMTIFKTLKTMRDQGQQLPTDASVLVRIYKLPKDNEDIVLQITHATNSQNPVDLKDLRSNDAKQQQLETSLKALGFTYRRKRTDTVTPRPTDISSGTAAEAILAVWRNAPHQAKFFIRQHFGTLYDSIFTKELNGAQTVVAVLLYRVAENHRRRPESKDPPWVRYASCFIAMQMGKQLLKNLQVQLPELDHRNFATAQTLIENNVESYFDQAVQEIHNALKALYAGEVSQQQMSATFRRGDLIERLV